LPNAPLDPATVSDLAALAGLPLEEDAAARIAAGASAAIAAVAANVRETLFDVEPNDYLATLEQLADAAAGGEGG
jgi:hypothetical protein